MYIRPPRNVFSQDPKKPRTDRLFLKHQTQMMEYTFPYWAFKDVYLPIYTLSAGIAPQSNPHLCSSQFINTKGYGPQTNKSTQWPDSQEEICAKSTSDWRNKRAESARHYSKEALLSLNSFPNSSAQDLGNTTGSCWREKRLYWAFFMLIHFGNIRTHKRAMKYISFLCVSLYPPPHSPWCVYYTPQ